MKIPTLLGLLILLLISAGVVFGAQFLHQNTLNPKPVILPEKIEQNNLSSDSITITWQTQSPTTTGVRVASDSRATQVLQDLKDNRDSGNPESRITHIVTINKLPNSPTFLKVSVNDKFYPDDAIQITPLAQTSTQFIKFNPIVGSVVGVDLRPINDALVFLLIDNAHPLATSVGQSGNFVLPLTQLTFKTALNDPQAPINGLLVIQKGNQKSEVSINITQDSQPLPPIVLGQNLDLR